MTKVGLNISWKHPEFGASPDRFIEGACCGCDCVEIECSFILHRNGLKKIVYKVTSY